MRLPNRNRNRLPLALAKRMARPFDPSALPSLALWLRSDQGVFADSGKTTLAGNGDPVACWADQSGSGRDTTQTTSARRPVLVNRAVNGNPAIAFDGIDDYLDVSAPIAVTDHSIFVVIQMVDGTQGMIVGAKTSGAYTVYRYVNDHLYYYDGVSQFNVAAPSLMSFAIVESNYTGTAWRSFVNGKQAGQDQAFVSAHNEVGIIGSRGNLDIYFPGSLAEVIVYRSALSDGNRKAVEGYLASRYKIV